MVTGPGGSNLYFKGLLDKLGVTANVYRVGTYKAAVEPFIRNDMSPEARENYLALDNATLETWRQNIRTARPKANVDLFLRDMNGAVRAAGGDMAKAALAAGPCRPRRRPFRLRSEARPARRQGHRRPGRVSAHPACFLRYGEGRSSGQGPDRRRLVSGMIVDGKGGAGNAGGDTIAREIQDGIRNKGIKALVVRVDSPGGSVLASERIRQALLEAKSKKIPVVVSMGSVAASGGYWIATPANFIYAEPSTITGSIGVFGVLPSFQDLAEAGHRRRRREDHAAVG